MVVFKFKTAINVDELISIQNFEFTRKSTRQGKAHTDLIGCKISGLRTHNHELYVGADSITVDSIKTLQVTVL